MSAKGFWISIAVLAIIPLVVVACRQPDDAGDKEKLLKIFDDVLAYYAQPGFKKEIAKARNSLAATRQALEVQERIAYHYGMSYDHYLDAVRRLKYDPQVEEKLDRVKAQIQSFHKFRFKVQNPTYAD